MFPQHFARLLLIHFLLLEVLSSNDAEFYNAVVVEYSPYLNSSSDADLNIGNNVKNYLSIITTAASSEHKADIIVFPESSLIGYLNKQKLLTVPDPNEKVNPCTAVDEYEAPLVELSCAARATSVYIVVNLSEKYFNTTQQKTVHYNTNVVFDRHGYVIARYRKIHLYVEGDRQPSPDRELVYFDTDFGVRFGLLTCFDIIFKDPGVDLAREHNVSHFIFTSAWFSQMPFLTAIQEQYHWAYTLDVVLLAAGYNMPCVGSTGSGIYMGRQGALTYVMSEARGSFMLQAHVPKRYPLTEDLLSVSSHKTTITKVLLTPQREELNVFFTKGLDLLRSQDVIKTKQDNMDVFSTELIQLPDSALVDPIVSKFTIPFTVEKSLCQRTLCCTFRLQVKVEFSRAKEDISRGDDFAQLYYRLAVFDGVKDYDGAATGGVQTCAVISCITRELHSCGLRSDHISAVTNTYSGYYQTSFVFESLEISGNVSTEKSSLVGPNVLLRGREETFGELLLPEDFVFTRNETHDKISMVTLKTLKPTSIVTASLYGRLFSRDGSQPTTGSVTEEESKLSMLNFRLDIVCFIFVTLVAKFIL